MDNYLVPAPDNSDEIVDYFVEQSTATRELDLLMWYRIGEILIKDKIEDVKQLKPIAQKMHRRVSDLLAAIDFWEKYPNFNSVPFDKATSWSKVKKDLGFTEKRPRKSLKKLIEERKEAHKITLKIALETGGEEINRNYAQGKYDEDMEILEEMQE